MPEPRIERIEPGEALRRQRAGALLVDVRESHERALGHAASALGVPLGVLTEGLDAHAVPPGQSLLLICQVGGRSLKAAQILLEAGYLSVASVEGGTERWKAEGLPIERPDGDRDYFERYSRHLRLPEIGEAGQQRLQSARIAMVGAGGLGSPAAYYLAAAGVGTLVLADDDVVDRSNLQRQILHTEARVGMAKVESARLALSALNPRVRIEAFPERVTSDNVEALIGAADVVIDGADNFPARYLLNDACVKLGKPLVYGAVHRFEGQASVFDAGRHRGSAPCYRCLFPEPPSPEDAPNCAEAGVLGVLPGVVGMIQATEAIKLLLELGEPLRGRLLHFDALAMRFRETRLSADPDCPVCAAGRSFPGYIDYTRFCAGD
ncbi:molybdopterin-synthase adenylyltransferase MoeB [Marilutibacter aestuarii]|uniref:Molybdopterin-synthase adenylyltransferase n=1 Tax=Marilutibacter aestuarii TaxID=1706195 RepID=A0A508A939_9GAMM|nr:molybdopterin-synthase adenylyltransferase MoeB [Lysobacter aestuarii]TQD46366.1 molybdopterin-synthase adenylyltransferase MoeB [Lysobacter aestuarii]